MDRMILTLCGSAIGCGTCLESRLPTVCHTVIGSSSCVFSGNISLAKGAVSGCGAFGLTSLLACSCSSEPGALVNVSLTKTNQITRPYYSDIVNTNLYLICDLRVYLVLYEDQAQLQALQQCALH